LIASPVRVRLAAWAGRGRARERARPAGLVRGLRVRL